MRFDLFGSPMITPDYFLLLVARRRWRLRVRLEVES